jgi:hypothetical protein
MVVLHVACFAVVVVFISQQSAAVSEVNAAGARLGGCSWVQAPTLLGAALASERPAGTSQLQCLQPQVVSRHSTLPELLAAA